MLRESSNLLCIRFGVSQTARGVDTTHQTAQFDRGFGLLNQRRDSIDDRRT